MNCPICKSNLELNLKDRSSLWKRIVREKFINYFWEKNLNRKRVSSNSTYIEKVDCDYVNARLYKYCIQVQGSPMGDTYASGIIVLNHPFNIEIFRGDYDELLSNNPWEKDKYYPKRNK